MEGKTHTHIETLLTPVELRALLKMTKRQLEHLVQNGKIPVRKVGRLNRFSPKEIEEWTKGAGPYQQS
jgi:excisionase family DNA binding protein